MAKRELDERLFTEEQLAERYGLAPGTLRNWRARRKGPRWIMVGGRPRYPESEVARWESSQPYQPG